MSEFMSRLHAMSQERRQYTLQALPFHLIQAEQTKRVTDLLTDFDFIQAKSLLMSVRDLVSDYQITERYCDDLNIAFPQWREWKYFITNVASILELYLTEYPQILFQEAYNSSKKGYVARAAQEWLKQGKCPKKFWLERVNRPEYLPVGPSLFVLNGHSQPIHDIALSQDGMFAVSGSADGTLRIWDTRTGACLRTLSGHTSSVLSINLTSDGLVLSASWDRTIRIWDVETGECLNTLVGHSAPVCFVSMLGESRILSTSFDGTIRLWSALDGACITTLSGHNGAVNHAISLGTHGELASASDDQTIRVWNINDNSQKVLVGHRGAVIHLTEALDGNLLSSAEDGSIIKWDIERGTCIRKFVGHLGPVTATSILSQDRLLSWSFDGTVRIWSLRTGRCLKVLEEHNGPVVDVMVLPQIFITASQDGTLRVWNTNTYEPRGVLAGHRFWVNAVAANSTGICVSGSSDRTVRLWDWTKATLAQDANDYAGQAIVPKKYNVATFTPFVVVIDHSTAISVIGDGEGYQRWDLISGKCVEVLDRNPKKSRLEKQYWEAMTQRMKNGFSYGILGSKNFVPSLNSIKSQKDNTSHGIGCFRARIGNGGYEYQLPVLAFYPLEVGSCATVCGFNRTIAFEERTRKAHVLLLKYGDKEWSS
jgi:WD40 repeat protein